jgi:hypothetical protein
MLLTGADKEYRKLHYWVEKQLGKPMLCWECGSTNRTRYEWANISRKYLKDTSDWKRMCVSCHQKYDYIKGVSTKRGRKNGTHCSKGHELAEDNVYFKKGRGVRECRICKSQYMRNFYERKRVAG